MILEPRQVTFLLFYIFIVGVSNFSIYFIVRHTDGPFDVLHHLRVRLGYAYLEVYDDFEDLVDIVEETPENGFFGMMLDCPWCFSTWYCLLAFLPLYFQYHFLIVFFSTFVSLALAVDLYGKVH